MPTAYAAKFPGRCVILASDSLQPDPIGADGYLFFRGWFNLVLSIYKYVSGDDKWERPFMVTGYGDQKFEWDHARIADLLARQYAQRPEGPHCENTKVWFNCNSAAALGLYLYDKLHGTQKHRSAESWLAYARDNYTSVARDGKLQSVTRYYDPLVNYKLNVGPSGGANIAFLLAPQQRELATFLYEAAAEALGWRKQGATVRLSAQGLIMARELGDQTAVAQLKGTAERESNPRFFGASDEKFGWFFHLKEAYPRGQQSAMMMVTEVGENGAWGRAFEAPHLDKFNAPTVEGIDFPALGVYQAWNDPATGILHVGTYPTTPDRRGVETNWRITKLANPAGVSVRCDGQPFDRVDVIGSNTIRLRTTMDNHQYQIFTNYRGGRLRADAEFPERATAATGASIGGSVMKDDPDAVRQASRELLAGGGPTCPCCAE